MERVGDGRTSQESFHIMCQGQDLDGKGWRSYKKEVNNKEGKMVNEVEKEETQIYLSLIKISYPTRQNPISYAVLR